MASFFGGKKKYGPAERAVDPKFEEAREHVAQLSASVAGVQAALSKLRSDQFLGVSEPAAAMRNFYQDEGKLPEMLPPSPTLCFQPRSASSLKALLS